MRRLVLRAAASPLAAPREQDNDVFLFGGRNVYRQLFEPNHNGEHYTMDDVESELSLPRHRSAGSRAGFSARADLGHLPAPSDAG